MSKVVFKLTGDPKLNKALRETLDLYGNTGFEASFAKIRLWDAPFEAIEKIVPAKGDVLELGCGDGILCNYLALSSKRRNVIGIEINSERIKKAKKGLANTKFRQGDIVKARYPKADCILLVHVLHHLPSKEDQETVIKKAKKALSRNGTLIIVEIIEEPIIKYAITWLTDAFIVPILFESKLIDLNFNYRKRSEWNKLLHEEKLKTKSFQAHKGMPFSHIVFVAKKV